MTTPDRIQQLEALAAAAAEMLSDPKDHPPFTISIACSTCGPRIQKFCDAAAALTGFRPVTANSHPKPTCTVCGNPCHCAVDKPERAAAGYDRCSH